MNAPAQTPKPPYYAVIFTSIRTDGDRGYSAAADETMELASKQPGFLGVESARQEVGVTVSYWQSLEAIRAWREDVRHKEAQSRAGDWFKCFRVRVCRVEHEFGRQPAR